MGDMGRAPRTVAAALLALIVVTSACTDEATRGPSTTTVTGVSAGVATQGCAGGDGVDENLVPKCGVLLGTIDAPRGAVPLGIEHQQATVDSSQAEAAGGNEGFRFELIRVYQRGSADVVASLNSTLADLAASEDRLVFFSWKVEVGEGAWAAVASGAYDEQLRAFAEALAASDRTIFVSLHHEPEGDREGTADEYVAMWRHAHDVIESTLAGADGAGRAVWVMNYTGHVDGKNLQEVAEFYPGDAYVDWMSYNPYNWAVCRGNADWRSFSDVARPMYELLTTDARFFDRSGQPKPILIGETATNEDPDDPARKAAWLRDMAEALEGGTLPQIKAVIYFNQAAPAFCDRHWDSSPDAADAFAEVATHPFFNPLSVAGSS